LWNFRAYFGYENTEGNYAEILQDNDNPVTVVCSENWSLEREQLRTIEGQATLDYVSAGRTAREFWWTSQELSPAGIIIITMAIHVHISPGG
jgi:hypothetical protein